MKTLAIYFSSPGALDYPLDNPIFLESYCEIIDALEGKGVQVGVVRADSYAGGGKWNGWFKKVGKDFLKQEGAFSCDLVWNRDDKNVFPKMTDCPVLNDLEFDEICRDKLKSADIFKDISARTVLLNSFEDFERNVSKMQPGRVVLKPRFGEQAVGVHVLGRNEVSSDLYKEWKDILLQDFLDSSLGIPGLVQGIHEIQVFVVSGNFAGARIKDYPDGVFVASATGSGPNANVFGVPKEKLPAELWRMTLQLDRKIERFAPRIYRADFVNTPQGYRLIEINSRPGVAHPSKEGADYWLFNGQIVDAICDFLE